MTPAAVTATHPDPQAVQAALGQVHDPELHRSLAELGMLGPVRVERGGVVRAEVALTTAGCPLREQLRAELTAAAAAVPGVRQVELTFTVLGEAQRARIAADLRAGAARQVARRIYAVASGKGGVGKSSVTANVAAALAAGGQRVGMWGYSVPQLFGVRRSPVVVSGVMLPVQAYGVQLMSTGFFVDDGQPVVWRGPMLHKALQQFLDDTGWGDLDVLLLDLPPGTGDITLSLVELLPDAALLAVTTPQLAAQSVAARVGRMAREMRMPVAGVVENMSALACAGCGAQTALFGTGGGDRLAEELGAPLLGRVPLDIALREAGDLGVPVVVSQPQSPSAVALRALAAALPEVRRSLVGRPLALSVT